MNGSPCAFTPDEMRAAASMWRDGTLVKDISDRIGRNRRAVCDMLNAAGIKRGKGTRQSEGWEERNRPVGTCREELRMREDAICGSNQLLEAILRASLRP